VKEHDIPEFLVPWQSVTHTNWTLDQAKYHYHIILGKMLQNTPQSLGDQEVPYLKAQHIQWEGVRIAELPMMWASPTEIETLRVKEGDLLVCEGGEVGRAAIATNALPMDCILQNAIHLVRPKASGDTGYLRYLLRHAASQQWLDVLCNKATIAHFTVEKFSEMWAWFPPLATQRAIATYLDRETAEIDAMIDAKGRLLGLLSEKRHALIAHAVTRGLDPAALMRDSGVSWIGVVPEHWEITNLKYVARIGNGSTPRRDYVFYWQDGTFPWLTSTVVNNEVIGEPTDFVTDFALRECHLPIVEPNSVLVAITGEGKTRGKAAILPYKATINQHMAYVTPIPMSQSIQTEFLQRYLSSSYEILRMLSEGTGSTKGALTCEQLGEFPVVLPPIPEQQMIIEHVKMLTKRFDSLHDATQKSIEILHERRAALIAAAVTGQINVVG